MTAAARGQLTPLAFTGSDVVFTTSADPRFSSTDVVLYAPASDAWRKAAAAPCALPAKGYTQVAWLGDRLAAACGTDSLQPYDPATDGSRTIAAGASPLNAVGWSAVVWTGTDLIVWSGTARAAGNPTPAEGASPACCAMVAAGCCGCSQAPASGG